MTNNEIFSLINFYKHINKISVKKNNDNNTNNNFTNCKIINNTNLNFYLKSNSNNNYINQNEKIFKTSKNTPNSSMKKLELNKFKENKDILENSNLNNNETMKIHYKINNKHKEIFDDFFIKKIKQVYSNKKSFHNKIKKNGQKSKSSTKLIINQKFNYNSSNTSKEKLIFDNSKTRLIKNKISSVLEFQQNKRNSNLISIIIYQKQKNIMQIIIF